MTGVSLDWLILLYFFFSYPRMIVYDIDFGDQGTTVSFTMFIEHVTLWIYSLPIGTGYMINVCSRAHTKIRAFSKDMIFSVGYISFNLLENYHIYYKYVHRSHKIIICICYIQLYLMRIAFLSEYRPIRFQPLCYYSTVSKTSNL